MAAILNLNNKNEALSYLNACHCFGRSPTNVDTVINAQEVSRIHAVVEWNNNQWLIRDLSNNGTWVNNQKLVKDNPHKLKVGDKIFFASGESHGFEIQDLRPPQNMLLPIAQPGDCVTESPIVLTDGNLLPSEQNPEIALFYVPSKDQWYKEFLIDTDGSAYPVANSDLLFFNNQKWQLKLIPLTENTVLMAKAKLSVDQIKYRFNLSLDEENTELTVTTDDEKFCLANKAHHYLTLSLARHRDEDAKQGIDADNQGWRLPETLTKELGCDITLFNTHVCRAKQQFRDMFDGACDGDELIERKGKKIRFAGVFYRIYKGNELIVNRGQDKVSLTVLHG
ncbi:FHA domain-containing protein [Colwellia psychrerythraea]|uniref:FHA domain protein n=1 Tax=Colwellia psychrerythraea (strain 34H / ATCC BAA-681) TaxID=167879 RepID=Q487L8_COLP3|nr:FHA domain-containing protein [Colwellia psychrerythraea]AAZ26624.1 FHA domain protein [Colwellia psychrerythraea 34H]